MNAVEAVAALKDSGYTKWRIAKELCVSWQTVHCWSVGKFAPSRARLGALLELLTHPPKA